MGTTRILCMLLVVAGTAIAYPQYAGVTQQEEQVAAAVPVQQQQHGADSTLTQEQQGALEEFWWQNQGVFTGENPGGTVVVVQEQSSQGGESIPQELSPFIPIPSPQCAALHGCVPWQNCIEGVFSQTVDLNTRTYGQAPEESHTLCGQIGNICCRIPDAILALQQQGQAGNIGGEIIEVINTGDGVVVVEEQVDGGAGPYVDGGEIIEVVSTGVGGAVPVVNQPGAAIPHGASGGVQTVVVEQAGGVGPYDGPGGVPAGGAQIVEVVNPGVAGTIPVVDQTGGAGPYDDAGGVQTIPVVDQTGGASVSVVQQTNVGVPHGAGHGSTGGAGTSGGIIEVIVDTEEGCNAYTHECVPFFQCIDGEINTSGVGLIDVRIRPQKECTNPDYPEVPGICCKIPGATIPPPVQTCPGTANCVTKDLCHAGVTITTGGTVVLDPLVHISCYLDYVDETDYSTGVCCQPPPPAPLETCPGYQVCVAPGTCTAQASATYDPSAVQECYVTGGTVTGECCDPPPTPPPTPAPLATCPGTEDCVANELCNAAGYIVTDGAGVINVRFAGTRCYTNIDTYATGVCCKPPLPPTPAPLVTCPSGQVCLSQGECDAATGGAGATYTSCLYPGSTDVGVCCVPPVKVIDTCPHDSVCLPEILCQGAILNDADEYIPYGNTGTWTQCGLSGDIATPGVCCRNIVVTPSPPPQRSTEKPYLTANQCGVRNHALDLRGSAKLQKNEAQFGEFPWQAIIFFTNYTYKCGASLIDREWLLTGAHCVNGYQKGDFRVRLGEWKVDSYDEPLQYVDVDIASITVHPEFNPLNLHNDFALIRLAAPVELQYHINTVCLPRHNQLPEPNTYCIATGWGKDAFLGNFQAILKRVDVPAVEKGYCQELLRKTRLGKYFILDDSFMCAGGEENKDACVGDGGGPLVCQDPVSKGYYVAGIVAWGIDCGVKDVPGVYADVGAFRPWIDSVISPIPLEQQEQAPNAYGRK